MLGKKEREVVKVCGKNFDCKEFDFDVNGYLINMEFGDFVIVVVYVVFVV